MTSNWKNHESDGYISVWIFLFSLQKPTLLSGMHRIPTPSLTCIPITLPTTTGETTEVANTAQDLGIEADSGNKSGLWGTGGEEHRHLLQFSLSRTRQYRNSATSGATTTNHTTQTTPFLSPQRKPLGHPRCPRDLLLFTYYIAQLGCASPLIVKKAVPTRTHLPSPSIKALTFPRLRERILCVTLAAITILYILYYIFPYKKHGRFTSFHYALASPFYALFNPDGHASLQNKA